MQTQPNGRNGGAVDFDAMRREVILAAVRRLRMVTFSELWDDLHGVTGAPRRSLERYMARRRTARIVPSETRLRTDLKQLRDDGLIAQHHINQRRCVWTPID